jgi:hypothetical protein
MSTQITWVHGNSGHLQVVGKNWGFSGSGGTGFFLEGNVQDATNHDEPWVQFHLPVTSLAVESAQQLPRLRQVMLHFTTDYGPPKPDTDWVQESSGYYKYLLDEGGAFITRLHVYDGYRRILAEDALHWHSSGWEDFVVEELPLSKEVEIRYGLGVSIRVRFINQMVSQKLSAGDPPNLKHVGFPVAGYKPVENSATRTSTKRAWISAVGCELVPAAP